MLTNRRRVKKLNNVNAISLIEIRYQYALQILKSDDFIAFFVLIFRLLTFYRALIKRHRQ
jgi:hypothetical protein